MLGLAEGSTSVHGHVGVEPSADRRRGRESRANLKGQSGENEFLSTGCLDSARHTRVVISVDRGAVDDLETRQSLDQLWNRRPPHAVARRRGHHHRQLQGLSRLCQGHYVVLEQGNRIVTDASHQADLVIDEDERRVFGRKRLIGTALCGHCFLLCWFYFSREYRKFKRPFPLAAYAHPVSCHLAALPPARPSSPPAPAPRHGDHPPPRPRRAAAGPRRRAWCRLLGGGPEIADVINVSVAVECCGGLLRFRPIARGGIQIRVDRTRLHVVDRDAPAPELSG